MTNKQLVLLLLEAATVVSDPDNGVPNRQAADLTNRLLMAAKIMSDKMIREKCHDDLVHG